MLVFVHGEDVTGALGKVTCRGHIGAQPEAARLFLHADDALGLGSKSCLQSLAHGFDRTWLVTAWPASAIQGPFLNGDVHLMVGGVHGAALRCRRFRIGAAAILLRLSGPGGGVDCMIRGLECALQPRLPPFVLRACVDDHRPIGGPVERDLARIGFLGSPRPVLGRLRVGYGPEVVPCMVGHSLGDDPSACVRGRR